MTPPRSIPTMLNPTDIAHRAASAIASLGGLDNALAGLQQFVDGAPINEQHRDDIADLIEAGMRVPELAATIVAQRTGAARDAEVVRLLDVVAIRDAHIEAQRRVIEELQQAVAALRNAPPIVRWDNGG